MLYREIIAVCSQIRTKCIHTVCEQNAEFVNVKLALEASWNVMSHAQKQNFVFRWNRRFHLNQPRGVSSVDCWQPRC